MSKLLNGYSFHGRMVNPYISFLTGMCGLHHYEPWTKRMLLQSWKYFQFGVNWKGPTVLHHDRHIVYSFCNYGIDHNDIVFSALWALGFFALLRTGEILQVKPCDVLLSEEHGIRFSVQY